MSTSNPNPFTISSTNDLKPAETGYDPSSKILNLLRPKEPGEEMCEATTVTRRWSSLKVAFPSLEETLSEEVGNELMKKRAACLLNDLDRGVAKGVIELILSKIKKDGMEISEPWNEEKPVTPLLNGLRALLMKMTPTNSFVMTDATYARIVDAAIRRETSSSQLLGLKLILVPGGLGLEDNQVLVLAPPEYVGVYDELEPRTVIQDLEGILASRTLAIDLVDPPVGVLVNITASEQS